MVSRCKAKSKAAAKRTAATPKAAAKRSAVGAALAAGLAAVHPQAAILQKKIPAPFAHLNRTQLARRRAFGPGAILKNTTRAAPFAAALGKLDPTVYERLIAAIMESKGIDPNDADPTELLDNNERVYAFKSGPCQYGTKQGVVHAKPMGGTGWVEFKVKGLDPTDPRFQWSVGYHGTDPKALLPIVDGGLSSPADRNCAAVHGQAGAAGAVGRTIYTSPCVGYAAHPVYGPLIKTGSGTYAQIILKVRVDQARVYNKLKTTLGKLYWDDDVPFDAQFALDDDMEWLVADRDAVFITGVLFRELGSDTEQCNSRYGNTACSFRHKGSNAEYAWVPALTASIKAAA